MRIDPPHVEGGDSGAISLGTQVRPSQRVARASREEEDRLTQRIRIVTQGIVEAFTETHDSTAVYYARHPEERKELVARIARLIGRVRE